MNKTIEALLRGYVLFDVNGKRFLRYNTALAERKSIPGNVEFNGLHIFKGWRCFFSRFKHMNITTTYDEAMVKAMIAEAVAKEREECAKVVEEYPHWLGMTAKAEISNAIRNRNNK